MAKRDELTPFRPIYRNITRRAKTINKDREQVQVYLTLEDLKDQWDAQGGKCYFSGKDLEMKIRSEKGKAKFGQASLDRIDNNLPYQVGNIRYVSLIANYALNRHFTDEELITFCKQVTTNHS